MKRRTIAAVAAVGAIAAGVVGYVTAPSAVSSRVTAVTAVTTDTSTAKRASGPVRSAAHPRSVLRVAIPELRDTLPLNESPWDVAKDETRDDAWARAVETAFTPRYEQYVKELLPYATAARVSCKQQSARPPWWFLAARWTRRYR